MNVAHFNTFLHGGAATAARRLHDSLVMSGVQSEFCYLIGEPPDDSYVRFPCERGSVLSGAIRIVKKTLYDRRLNHHLAGRPEGYELFSYSRLPHKTALSALTKRPSIIHLHWIADFLDYPSFFASVPPSLPIVWTLHDMNPFTGGCHYAETCRRYETNCCYCPQLGIPSSTDLSTDSFLAKCHAVQNKNLHIVGDSHWLEGEARNSAILSNARSFRTIHYGIDIHRFSPRDTMVCRAALGVDPAKAVIAFGAHSVHNKRKGLSLLLSALQSFHDEDNVALLVFGSGGSLPIEPKSVVIKELRFVDSPDLLSIIHSAADVFVIPSLYEAFGQTALEAMACGTPVVGFETGGIPDLIRPGETGLLAKPGDHADLASNIRWMINHPDERIIMGQNARRMVEEEFTLGVQARAYINLYQELTNSAYADEPSPRLSHWGRPRPARPSKELSKSHENVAKPSECTPRSMISSILSILRTTPNRQNAWSQHDM